MRRLLLLMLVLRAAICMGPLLLTLHVVLDMHLGFAESGLNAALLSAGSAIGAPACGHLVDRVGLRLVTAVTLTASCAFWATVNTLPYALLVPAAFAAGLLSVPAFSLSRQCIAALLPGSERQAGYAADSMSVEISYAVGPPIAILIFNLAGSRAAFAVVTGLVLVGGLGLFIANPPTRGGEEPRTAPGAAVGGSRRVLAAILVVSFGATFTLLGTEAALTARVRQLGAVPVLGMLIAIWCIASLLGGFVYGSRHRTVRGWLLLAVLAALVIPISAGPTWWSLAVLIVPSGVFCAPVLSATADSLSRIAPAGRRGWIMGMQSSALTLGGGAGAIASGFMVDGGSPVLAIAGMGALGLILAGAAALIFPVLLGGDGTVTV
jgi:predicted MFS family arabinose efflux permease